MRTRKRYIAFSAPKSAAYAYTLVKINNTSNGLTAVNLTHSENMDIVLEYAPCPFKSWVVGSSPTGGTMTGLLCLKMAIFRYSCKNSGGNTTGPIAHIRQGLNAIIRAWQLGDPEPSTLKHANAKIARHEHSTLHNTNDRKR